MASDPNLDPGAPSEPSNDPFAVPSTDPDTSPSTPGDPGPAAPPNIPIITDVPDQLPDPELPTIVPPDQ